jgi:hypothetical protein
MSVTVKEARRIVGQLSNPSKMPGYAWSIPAEACKIGGLLRRVANSPCKFCYALKGRYRFDGPQRAMRKRLRALASRFWVAAMVVLIRELAPKYSRFFRWFDSGDLQSGTHLEQIVAIALVLPEFKFWLPTQEHQLIEDYLTAGGIIPENLTIRLSAHTIDAKYPPQAATRWKLPSSMVYRKQAPDGAHDCPAHLHFNICDECRACWDKSVELVGYPLH